MLIFSTPGHTPDELAWYDETERWLYVGDTFYERLNKDLKAEIPIIFPSEGDWVDVMTTLETLLAFVRVKNVEQHEKRVKIACGHITSDADGEELLAAVQRLFWDILRGNVPVKETKMMRDEPVDLWMEDGHPRFSVRGPRRLVEEARKYFKCRPR